MVFFMRSVEEGLGEGVPGRGSSGVGGGEMMLGVSRVERGEEGITASL